MAGPETRTSAQSGGADNTRPMPTPPDDGWWSREHALVLVLVAGTVLTVYVCYLLVRPFLPAVAWALALAVVTRPLHARIAARIPNADAAAVTSLTLIVLILVGPALLLGGSLASQLAEGVERVQDEAGAGSWQAVVEQVPQLRPAVDWINEHVDVEQELRRALAPLISDLASLVRGSIWAAAQFLIMLLTLYYFLRDQPRILRAVRFLVPLSKAEADEVLRRITDTIYATVYGTLLVALIQGALGGLMFWWLGLPAPLLWGVVMGLLAVIPWLGAFIVWAPAAALLMLQGAWVKGLVLIAWGLVVVGLIDNLLYPVLVGNTLRMHTLLVFFAIVGGLLLFGGSGVVLGPIVLAIAAALMDVWQRRTRDGRTAEATVG
jgi:predicted PurR-regulated permease PerM